MRNRIVTLMILKSKSRASSDDCLKSFSCIKQMVNHHLM